MNRPCKININQETFVTQEQNKCGQALTLVCRLPLAETKYIMKTKTSPMETLGCRRIFWKP